MNSEIRRYNAPRGTTLCEDASGELVLVTDHDDKIELLRRESSIYRRTLRCVLKDIRDDIARGGLAESWDDVAETISIVLKHKEPATPAPEVRHAEQSWESFDDWLAWELDQGDRTTAATTDAEMRLARRLWFCLKGSDH